MNLFPSDSGDRIFFWEQKWVSRSSPLLIGREREAYVLLEGVFGGKSDKKMRGHGWQCPEYCGVSWERGISVEFF